MSIVYLGKATPASGSGGGSGNVDWGDIGGTLSDQTDLQTALNAKQDTLTAGSGIDITNNVISATVSGLTNTATGSGSLTILGTATSGIESINIGASSLASGYDAIAIGSVLGDNDPTSAYNDAVAIGWSAIAYNYSIAIGTLADARASTSSVVIGSEVFDGEGNEHAEAGDYAVSVGAASKSDDYSVAVGANSYAMYNYSIALGYGAEASQDYEFVVGGYDTQNSQPQTFTLMDLSTGKIPNDRINGVSGSFTSQDGKTVTVTNGVITSIV